MGACGSLCQPRATVIPGELAEQHAASRDIEEQNFKDLEEEKKITKCLLLGTGDCGKSTILKQMKLLHDGGFNDSELRAFVPLIRRNTVEAMQTLCRIAADVLKVPFRSDDHKARAARFLGLNLTGPDAGIALLRPTADPTEWVMDLLALWRGDDGIAKAFAASKAHDLNLLDSAEYFLNAVERTFHPSYLPTDTDVLRARSQTVGIQQMDFVFERRRYRMYDVGGQRGDRKKWIHYFSGVSVILWVASLSEYNQHSPDDPTKNRLVESVKLYEALSGLPWFRDKPLILFLNKADIFRAKIETIDLGVFFPKYTGRKAHFQDGVEFIRDLFVERTRGGHHNANTNGNANHGSHGHAAAAANHNPNGHGNNSNPTAPGSPHSTAAGGYAAAASGHRLSAASASASASGISSHSRNGAVASANGPALSRSAVHPHTLGVPGAAGGAGGNIAALRSGRGAGGGGGHSSSHGAKSAKLIYTHVTDATHTDTIALVWRASITHILDDHLKLHGGFS